MIKNLSSITAKKVRAYAAKQARNSFRHMVFGYQVPIRLVKQHPATNPIDLPGQFLSLVAC